MIDALGQPQSLAVLGGTSEIGLALAHQLVRGRCRSVVLAGRDEQALVAAAERLGEAAPNTAVRTVGLQAADTSTHDEVLDSIFAVGDIDVVLVVIGVLGDQDEQVRDADAGVAAATANYLGPVSLVLRAMARLERQGHGVLVVLSSLAAERPRRSMPVYASAKAGLDALCQALSDRHQSSGVHIIVVRPGFVATRMTAGLPLAPLATTPEAVANAIVAALSGPSKTVWVPGTLRYVGMVLRHIPRVIFRRLSF